MALSLDAEQWTDLRHAYENARDTPHLLRELTSFPPSKPGAEPWHSLWSSLYHQGDIFSASFAAVPHIVNALATAPQRAGFDYFLLPASIEVARVENNVAVPAALRESYFEAVARLPGLAGAVLRPNCDADLCRSALAACAASAGDLDVARLLIEVDGEDIPEVLKWYEER
jgi:hypothetical protein